MGKVEAYNFYKSDNMSYVHENRPKMKMCYKCKAYLKHDANFGYCKKYQCQARSTDTCKVIQEMVK